MRIEESDPGIGGLVLIRHSAWMEHTGYRSGSVTEPRDRNTGASGRDVGPARPLAHASRSLIQVLNLL